MRKHVTVSLNESLYNQYLEMKQTRDISLNNWIDIMLKEKIEDHKINIALEKLLMKKLDSFTKETFIAIRNEIKQRDK
jgi:hypothetical protein